MMSSVFAVYCDGKSHFIIGTDTADVLSKARLIHPDATEIRMTRCKDVPEAARMIRDRYWPMNEDEDFLPESMIAATLLERMYDTILYLEQMPDIDADIMEEIARIKTTYTRITEELR